ncbi:MAG: sigma-70 family RNA polymerase sigma factor, partial [Actinomycetota bacterium]|nr:sigma-70 family RNA polymerase sigma factor [Actinomycetota bacterium]
MPADFEAVFRRLYPRARAVAYRIVGEVAEAEDAAAEAFSRTLLAWRRVGDLPYLDAWVLRVTANVAVDVVRRRRPAPLATLTSEAVPGPDEVVVLRMALAAALAALPRRQREVVALRYLVGLREDEVARSMGVSLGSVKRHGHRALARLRRRLGTDWDWAATAGSEG